MVVQSEPPGAAQENTMKQGSVLRDYIIYVIASLVAGSAILVVLYIIS